MENRTRAQHLQKVDDRRIRPLRPANSAGQLTEKLWNCPGSNQSTGKNRISLRIRDRARRRELLGASAVLGRRQWIHGSNRREQAGAVARLL
jgi:hypothetical protein